MAHVFNYAIITAIPDQRRGERVNVGIIIFYNDRLEVRFSDLRKIKALSEGDWDGYAARARAHLLSMYQRNDKPSDLLSRFSLLDNVINFSEVSWFSIDRIEEFETRVDEILMALVQKRRPAEPKRAATTRINTEIAKIFGNARVLAKPGEGMVDGKVERNVLISEEDNLTADFGVKNGTYQFTATLDLRRARADQGQAAIKSITLDRAKKRFDGGVKTFGVFAAPDDREFRPLIHMFRSYADRSFNWLDPSEQTAFLRATYDAIRGPERFDLLN